MKKKFLKVALFSLIMAAPATSFVSCTDYDDDITNLTTNDDKLQEEFNNKLEQQAKALDAKIEELKTAQTALEASAKKAGEAAEAAAKAAADAQKTGDEALQQAMTANAQAEAALKAVDEAKAAVLAETIEQIKALKESIDAQIADLKAQYGKDYEALTAAINESTKNLEKQIADLKAKHGEDYDALEAAIAECAKKSDITALQQQIASLNNLSNEDVKKLVSEYLTNIGINETTISGINGRLAAIDTQIAQISTDVAGNTTAITDICDRIIPGLKSELEGKISALDLAVNNHITAFNQYKAQVDAQLLALNTFKETYETLLAGLSDNLDNLDGKIDGVADDLADLKALVEGMTGEDSGVITELKGTVEEQGQALTTIQNDILALQGSIKEISGNLNILAQQSAKRLTSITLVPTAYRDGIPTIDFFTAEFTPLGKLDKTTGLYEAAAPNVAKVVINSENAKVLYRLNPAGVTLDDIIPGDVSFAQVIATSRAAENTPVIKVNSVQKSEDGILEVYATKDAPNKNVDNAGSANNFYTVALKVPIAEKNLYSWTVGEGDDKKTVTEDPADAVVYSEYARVSDTYFTPAITATSSLEDPDYSENNLFAWGNVTTADALTKVSYNSVTDLNAYVTGCMNYDSKHLVMTADEMKNFGFTLEYSLFGQKYEVNGVNQQIYATVSKDGKLTPVTPKDGNILNRLGKTPVVEVVMKDAKGNVIAQKFIKVELTLVGANTKFEIAYPSVALSCTTFDEYVTWEQINSVIISKLGFDMTKAQFVANYTATVQAGVTVDLNATGEDENQPVVWTIGVADMILGGNDLTIKKEIKFTNAAGLYPDLTLTLKVTVTWPTNLPALGKTVPALWNNGVLRVLPQAMPVPYDNSTATYNTNILQGRQTPYLTNLLDCSQWDIVFRTAPAGYEVDENDDYKIVLPGEKETDPATDAAQLWYDETGKAAFDLSKADAEDTGLEAMFYIENNAAGIAMVENEMTIGLGWNIELTGETGNPYNLNNTSVKIIKPLQKLTTANIEPITQNSQAQTRDLSVDLTITDAFGNKFKKYAFDNVVDDYWKYYGISSVDWTSGDMTVTDKAGTVYQLSDLNLHFDINDSGVLTYTGSGAALNEPVTLNVPVVVEHKWGKLKDSVHITINPGI